MGLDKEKTIGTALPVIFFVIVGGSIYFIAKQGNAETGAIRAAEPTSTQPPSLDFRGAPTETEPDGTGGTEDIAGLVCYYVGTRYPTMWAIFNGPFGGQNGIYYINNTGGYDANNQLLPGTTVPGESILKHARKGKYYDTGDGLCHKQVTPLPKPTPGSSPFGAEYRKRSVPVPVTVYPRIS